MPDPAANPIQPIPAVLQIERGGFGGFDQLCLESGQLYHTPEFEKQAHRVPQPSMERWISFRHALDRLGVWQWHHEYVNSRIHDGTQWSVMIEYRDGAVIRSTGSNAYPSFMDADYEENGKQSLDWHLFMASLRWLTNNRYA